MHHNAYLDHKQNAPLTTPLLIKPRQIPVTPNNAYKHLHGRAAFVFSLYPFVNGDIGDAGRFVSSCEKFRSADCSSVPMDRVPFDCSAFCITTTVVFAGCAAPFVSGGVVSSSSSGIGEQYSFSTFLSCGLRIGFELARGD